MARDLLCSFRIGVSKVANSENLWLRLMVMEISPLVRDEGESLYALSLQRKNFARPEKVAEAAGSAAATSAKDANFAAQLASLQLSGKVDGAASPMAQIPDGDMAPAPLAAPATPVSTAPDIPNLDGTENFGDDSEFSFYDLLDIVNPLQHIPILGSFYREATGDTIKPVARVVGDVLYGALTGTAVVSGAISLAGVMLEQYTGVDPMGRVAEAVLGDKPLIPNDLDNVKVAQAPAASSSMEGALPDPAMDSGSSDGASGNDGSVWPDLGFMMADNLRPTFADYPEASPVAPPPPPMPAAYDGEIPIADGGDGHAIDDAQAVLAAQYAAERGTEVRRSAFGGVMDTNPIGRGGIIAGADGAAAASGLQASDGSLPPDFVRDMMTLALEKYRVAQESGALPSTAVAR